MPGKLVHFELPAQDTQRARDFWSSVFGWTWNDPGMAGFEYWMTQTSAEQGGAIYPSQQGERGPIVYFDSVDIDATLAAVRERGGTAAEKMPIPEIGWFARCTDTEGNEFSVFQRDEAVKA
jgi:predicted enzyme related to lactoylglutathione lyase